MTKCKIALFAPDISHRGRGLHRYQLGFIEALNKINLKHYYFDIYVRRDASDLLKINNKNINIIEIDFYNNLYWLLIQYPIILLKNNYDVIHSLNDSPILFMLFKGKLIITLIESVKERRFEFVKQVKMIRYFIFRILEYSTLKRANIIICISKYNRIKLLSKYPQYKKKVLMEYPGLSSSFKNSKFYNKERQQNENYTLIMISGLRDYKIEYIDYLVKNSYVKCVGCVNRDMKINYPTIDFNCNISDYDLSMLYKNASIYVHLSFIEGLGYSILESLVQRTKVLAPNSTAIKELLPKHYLYSSYNEFKLKFNKIVEMNKDDYFSRINIKNFKWKMQNYIKLYDQFHN